MHEINGLKQWCRFPPELYIIYSPLFEHAASSVSHAINAMFGFTSHLIEVATDDLVVIAVKRAVHSDVDYLLITYAKNPKLTTNSTL